MDATENTLRRFASSDNRPSLSQSLTIAHLLAQQARDRHDKGHWHGDIRLETVECTESGNVRLLEPVGVRAFGGEHVELETCPPECAGETSLRLPLDIRQAGERLRQAGLEFDVRRIDVYQIGVVLCQLLTGDSIRKYAESPRLKGSVPPEAREILDRTLGYDSPERVQTCDALCELLEAAEPQLIASAAPHAETPVNRRVSPDTKSLASGSLGLQSQLPCERLAHFRLLKLIGRGGMGEVYLAHDEKLDRPAAVKILRQDLTNDDSFVGRFQTEVDAIKQLPHPNLLPLYSSGAENGRRFYAMRFVDGPSLAGRLRTAPLALSEAIDIALQCLSALSVAHDEKLIHRDIKPGNVLLETATGRAFLVDFGLARRVDDSQGLTRTGVVVGSLQYLSPEQARGDRQIDHRADLYSFGVMFYQMLAGQLPFAADSEVGWIFQHVNEPPRPLATAAPHLPPELYALVDELLAKKAEDRPRNCRTVIERLQPLQRPTSRALQFTSELSSVLQHTEALPAPALVLPSSGAPGVWERFRDGAATIIRQQTPKWVEGLQSDEQRIDAAIAQHERRLRRLKVLQAEGHQLLRDLRGQAQGLDKASPTAERATLDTQIVEISEQVANVDLQVAQASAALLQLTGTRDALQARLQQAQWSPTTRKRSAAFGKQIAVSAALVAIVCTIALWAIPRRNPTNDKLVSEQAVSQQLRPAIGDATEEGWHELLPATDIERDRVFGTMRRVPDGIGFSPEGRSLLTLPGALPANYDLELEFTKTSGSEGIAALVPIGDRACCAYFGGWGNRQHGVFNVRGQYEAAGSAAPGSVLAKSRQRALVQARTQTNQATITLMLDGKMVFAWQGDPRELSLSPEFASARLKSLGVTTYKTELTLHHARWRPAMKSEANDNVVEVPLRPQPATDNQAQIAAAVIKLKGKLRVAAHGHRFDVADPAELPTSGYEIINVDLSECRGVNLELLKLMGETPTIEGVRLLSTGVGDAEIAQLKDLPRLRSLSCGNSPATGSCLARFGERPSLVMIAFGGRFEGKNLQHFRKFPRS